MKIVSGAPVSRRSRGAVGHYTKWPDPGEGVVYGRVVCRLQPPSQPGACLRGVLMMMMELTKTVCAASLLSLVALGCDSGGDGSGITGQSSDFASVDFDEGQWEMTVAIVEGGSRFESTISFCLKAPDTSFEGEGTGSIDDCNVSFSARGNTVVYDSTCSFEGSTTTSSGEFTYAGDTMSGFITVTDESGTTRIEYSGRRTGGC